MIGSFRDTNDSNVHKKEGIHKQQLQEQDIEHAIELSKMRLPKRSSSKVGHTTILAKCSD